MVDPTMDATMEAARERAESTPLRYRVEGMDCPSCAGKIETAVGRLAGARDIRVNYQRQVLAFRLDEAATPRVEVEERIRKLGYGVAPVEAPTIIKGGEQALDPGRATPAWRAWFGDPSLSSPSRRTARPAPT